MTLPLQPNQQIPFQQTPLAQLNTPVYTGYDNTPRLKIYPEQLVILVADDSVSMSGSNSAELTVAAQKLISELNDPKNKDGFRFSVIRFGSDAHVEASCISPANTTISFTGSSGTTNAAAGLALAKTEIQNFVPRADRRKANPIVIFMSDGCLDESAKAIRIASDLKANFQATIVAVSFGSGADKNTMKHIATSDEYHAEAEVGSLSKVFVQVGKTVTNSLQQMR